MSLVILTSIINALIDDLTSYSLLHQLMGETLILKLNKMLIEDLYALLVEGTSRYDSSYFYRIVIDISVSKYFIASFS
jgi:hypothetical protein